MDVCEPVIMSRTNVQPEFFSLKLYGTAMKRNFRCKVQIIERDKNIQTYKDILEKSSQEYLSP